MLRLSQFLCGGYLAVAVLVTVLAMFIGPLGSVPFPLPVGPPRDPIVVSIAYGTEKQEWLEEAKTRFEATNPRVHGRPVQIQLEGIGSREIVTRIVQDNYQPVVVSPASSIQIELLRDEWQTRNGTDIVLSGSDAPQPLVLTPLVVVAWEERARALWSNGPEDFWHELHDTLADPQGWATRGHPEWGFVKFGHTSPETSNSGIQTLVLLAYGYHGKSRDLTNQDILDSAFQQWVDEIERSVLEFGDSTGTFMTNIVRFGPGKYDFVVVYENLAIQDIETAEKRWGPIRVYYPPENLFSDHPYAILNAAWVTPDQQEAAAHFRDFLLSQETQELALQYGFRPANTQVGFDNPDIPFIKYASYGIQPDIPSVVAVPPADVLNNLIDFWRRQGYDR